jgi:hypothetical protein
VDDLATALDHLRQCCDAAGRDVAELDVTFACHAGGDPSSDDFNAAQHLEGIAALETLGVTWLQVGVPGDDIARTLDTFAKYGEVVITNLA